MEEYIPISDGIDRSIIMHRDAHFGGNFSFMLDYYCKEGVGTSPEISIERIKQLAQIEEKLGQNLAAALLSGADAELIGRAQTAYRELRDLYEDKKSVSQLPLLIADLVLSEEENPGKEIDAIVAEGSKMINSLLSLLCSDDMHHPLFPGYGRAPQLAAICLGKIGDKKAISALFESLGSDDYLEEERSIRALAQIGEPAKEFLLHVLRRRPFTSDNEYAAIVLEEFKNDPEVARHALSLLLQTDVRKHSPLSTYVVLNCGGLASKEEQAQFRALATDPSLSKDLRRDIEMIAKQWDIS